MLWLFGCLVGLAVFALVLLLVGALFIRLGKRRYGYATTYDLFEEIIAPDGWRLGAERHLAEGERLGVVITCHGLVNNHFNMDLQEGHSVVRYLRSCGYEVWNLDLRGAGHSKPDKAHPTLRPDWSFDDYIRKDIPAILEVVTERAGVEQVHWVGHSMGGMVMYAYLGCNPEEKRIASFCAIGSPGAWYADWKASILAGIVTLVPKSLMSLRIDLLARSIAPIIFRAPLPLPLGYPPNFHLHTMRRSVYTMMEPYSRALAIQFSRMFRDNTFDSEDQRDDYKANLSKITTPACFIVGSIDLLAGEALVRPAFEAISSPIKEIYIASRENGASMDYCHGALIFGKNAQQEIYPLISRWLDDRDRQRSTSRAESDHLWKAETTD